jgi:hypothetical protein
VPTITKGTKKAVSTKEISLLRYAESPNPLGFMEHSLFSISPIPGNKRTKDNNIVKNKIVNNVYVKKNIHL